MATAPYFPFPSAATFPPPIFPGGYSYPSPFPAPASGDFSTPAFPSAATYSHPQDIWSTPSTAPGLSIFVHPHPPPPPAPAYSSPNPTQIPNHPPLAASPVHGDLHHATYPHPHPEYSPWPDPAPRCELHAPAYNPTAPLFWAPTAAPTAPPLASSTVPTPSSPRPLPAPGPWTPPPPPSGAPSSSTSGTPPFPPVQGVPYSPPTPSDPIPLATSSTCSSPALPVTSTASPACGYFTEAAAILHRVQRELSNLQGRLCQQQAREQTSFNTLQGELAKLKARVSQCAVSAGKQSTRATPGSSPLQVIGTAPVTPKVFDELPTPSSCNGIGTTSPASTASMLSNASTPARSSASSRSSSIATAYVAPEMFDISYVDTKGCTDEFVVESASTPEQQLYEEPQMNALVIHERRREWDPGATPFHVLFPTVTGAIKLQCRYVYNPELVRVLAGNFGAGAAPIFASAIMCWLAFEWRWTEVNAVVLFVLFVPCSTCQSSCLPSFEMANLQWGPGIALSCYRFSWLISDRNRCRTAKALVWLQSQLLGDLQPQLQTSNKCPQVSDITDRGAITLQCTNVSKSAMVHLLVVQFGARKALFFTFATMCSYASGMGWKKVNLSALLVLAVSSSTCTSTANQSMVLSHSGNSRTTHIYLKLLIQLLGAATTEQRHALEPSLMVVMLLNGSKFTDGQLAYMPQGTSISCSEWVRHMTIVPSCWSTPFEMAKLQWDPGIALASEMHSMLEILRAGCQTVKALSWSTSSLLNDLRSQFSVSKTSHVWDTGSGFLYLSYKRLNISKMIQINSSSSMTYTGVTSYEIYQWEFLLQHGVQKNYNAKSLISPQKYLQLSKMDIIFSTFLPP